MRNFSKIENRLIYLLSALIVALGVSGCTMTADDTLGSNMMPEGQLLEMRHLKYQGNTKLYFDADLDRNVTTELGTLIETRQYRTDSLLASNTGMGYMGVRRSDIFGTRYAGFASSMLFMNALDEELGFGYKPIFDTMRLVLSVTNYGGDTLVPIKYQVFELKKALAGNVLKYDEKRQQDSVAYINCDLSSVYDQSKPIFEFTFPNSELGEGPSTLLISLENTEHSWDYVRRLMLIPDDYASPTSTWDGYGRSGIEFYSDDEKWANKFYGVYIKPVEESVPAGKEGAMYALDLSASGLILEGRSRNPKDPSMIQDTVGMNYYFLDSESAFNTSVNKVSRDYNKGLSDGVSELGKLELDASLPRAERETVSTCYVEGLGGPAVEIYLTDALLEDVVSLAKLGDSAAKLGVNQCLMSIYVKDAFYKWEDTQNNASNLIDMLDKSFTRMGAYLNYNTLSPIIDYDYIYEQNYTTESNFGGYLDRSRGCYVMNITAHIQRLLSDMRQNDGTFDISKADERYRTIYIGTEATAPYAFSESILQGMDKDDENQAPIAIDLTYTLIK